MQLTISKKAIYIVIVLILVAGIAFMASKIFSQPNNQNDLSNSSAPVTNTTAATGQNASDPYANTTVTTSPDSNSYMGIQGGTGGTTSDSNYSGTATSGTDNTGGTNANTTGVGAVGGDSDGDDDD
jgi:cytoskeletal protein RodZ